MLNVSADNKLKVFFTARREQLPNTVAVDKCHEKQIINRPNHLDSHIKSFSGL